MGTKYSGNALDLNGDEKEEEWWGGWADGSARGGEQSGVAGQVVWG